MENKVNDNAQGNPRRTLIKALAGGTVAGGVLLPARWTKPVVDTVLMPAHAQVSPGQNCNVDCDFRHDDSYGSRRRSKGEQAWFPAAPERISDRQPL